MTLLPFVSSQTHDIYVCVMSLWWKKWQQSYVYVTILIGIFVATAKNRLMGVISSTYDSFAQLLFAVVLLSVSQVCSDTAKDNVL